MSQVEALLDQLTVEEKATLVSGKDFWFTEPVKRLGLESIMVTDGPSGLRKQADSADALGLNNSVKAVSFPVSALTASSFSRDVLTGLGKQLGMAANANQVSVLLGPGVNIKRSPLAGRNFEYFSEDPLVAGELGSAYVQGVQSQGVGVSVKHFAANNRENQRFTSSSNIDERTLREIYLAAFERIVKTAAPETLMCSYNKINGVLNSQNAHLLTQILRDEWGFQGLVMSDWGAVANPVAAVKSGLDLEMPGKGDFSVQDILAGVNDGRLSEAQLDVAVRRVLKLVLSHLDTEAKATSTLDEQHTFARKAAANSMVLLKNDADILPIKATEQVAMIGELAAKPRYQGGGSSHVNAYQVVSPLDVASDNVTYAQGYSLDGTVDQQLVDQAIETAKQAAKVVIFAGVPEQDESEGFDKSQMDLPDNQTELISQLAKVNANVVVVLQNGSAITMPWLNDVKGVLETYLAGEAVGEATWDVLTGVVNPSGKLAETFPLRIEDTPAYGTFNASLTDENYREGMLVGYRYYDTKKQPVLFPFGYGLSYTNFAYRDLQVTEQSGQKVLVTVNVTNTGDVAGQEVVQVYVANHASRIEKPAKELRAFDKVELAPGETKSVSLKLDRRAFSWYNPETSAWTVDNGDYDVIIGQSSMVAEASQTITLAWATEQHATVDSETYFADILKRDDLKEAITASGMDKVLALIQGDDAQSENAQLLENIPLRSAAMFGADDQMIQRFIKLANQ